MKRIMHLLTKSTSTGTNQCLSITALQSMEKGQKKILDHDEILELGSVGGRKLSFQLPPLSIAEERQD